MLEVEIQKLTAAVEALTTQMKNLGGQLHWPTPVMVEAPTLAQVSEPVHEPVKPAKASKKVAEPAPAPAPSVSKENLKDLALQISRADSNTKSEIVSILASHNAKTITALPDGQDVLFDVFTRLNNLAARVAKAAE